MRRALPVAAGVTLVALTLAACGGSSASSPSSGPDTGNTASSTRTATSHSASSRSAPSTSSTTSRRAPRRHRSPALRGPKVGARQGVHIDGSYLTVTILHVLDLSHTGSPTLPGTRQVGVQLRIADQSGQTYDSTSSGDVSLVLSTGQSEPLDIREGICQTQLVDFESHVYPGDVRIGCVGFSVPRAAHVLGVRFSPFSRPPGTLTWRTG